MKSTTRIAAYLRMSSDKQDKSIAEQRREVERYAAERGYKIVAWYTDEAVSGWKSKERQGFHQIIADASNGSFQGVLCWDQARFSRFDPMEANYFWHILRTAGVFLETVKEGRIDWDSLGGWLTASVHQHGKAEYVRSLAQDVTRGRRAAVMARKWICSPPFGYRLSNSNIFPDEPDASVVRRIFELRASGTGTPTICDILNSEHILSPRGKKWTHRVIRMMLVNQTYIGNQVIGRFATGKFCRLTDKPFTNEGTHEAIIDHDLWERVQRVNRLRTNYHPSRSGKKPGGPLSGLVICKNCGAKMFFEKRRDRYICSTHCTGNGCNSTSVSNSLAMRIVTRKIREMILMGSVEALAAHIAKLQSKPVRQVADLAKQRAELDRKIAAAAERLLDVEPALVPAVQLAMRKLQERRDSIAEKKPKGEQRKQRTPRQIAEGLWELDKVLRCGDVIAVRTALLQVIAKIELTFERHRARTREWVPAGGSIFFFNYSPLNNLLEGDPAVRTQKTVRITKKDLQG